MALTCQRCQTELVPLANYCHHCGRRVEAGATAKRPILLRVAIVVPSIVATLAWCLLFAEVKSVVFTGPILLMLGIILIVVMAPARYGRGRLLGLMYCGICLLFVLLVNAFNLSPPDARMPFISLGLLFLAGTIPLTISAYRHVPVQRDPGRCAKCGYILYGLTEPRCPECGTVFDPGSVAAIPPR